MQTNYAYGDNSASFHFPSIPEQRLKILESGDAANFGIFKQNWYMIRAACSRFSGQSASQYNNGAALNSDLNADIECRHASQNYYGYDRWFAGHRNGQSGIEVSGSGKG